MILTHSCHRELGEDVSDDELKAMLDEFDQDQDGESTFIAHRQYSDHVTVNEQEFLAIMMADF